MSPAVATPRLKLKLAAPESSRVTAKLASVPSAAGYFAVREREATPVNPGLKRSAFAPSIPPHSAGGSPTADLPISTNKHGDGRVSVSKCIHVPLLFASSRRLRESVVVMT